MESREPDAGRRDSEAQVIARGQWTRLHGTDAEILIPHQGGAGGGSSFGAVMAGGGGAADGLVIRVRKVP